MPITRSAKKALRVSLRRKAVNDRLKKLMRESIKKVERSVAEKKTSEAKASVAGAYRAIDKAVKKGVLQKNTAARKKSRLSKITKEK